MTAPSAHLPGRLGKPDLTLAEDPRLDPVLRAFIAGLDGAMPADVTPARESSYDACVARASAAEAALDPYYAQMCSGLPPVEGMARRTEIIEGVDGNAIELFIHEPAHRDGVLPGIVHTHGGGMVICAAADPQYVRWRDELAATGLCVVGVEFRNGAGKLGNHPFPAGLNDCASGTHWTWRNRAALGISHVVVSGESGGGNLCLAVALKAQREGWIDEIAGVYSCCPYIAGQYSPAPAELVSWTENGSYQLDADECQDLVKVYDPTGTHTHDPLAWPYRAKSEDLAGLPPHTISVNELDPLRDEGLVYARHLMAAGVQTASRTVNGTYHGGDTEAFPELAHLYGPTIRDIQGFAASLAPGHGRG